MDSTIAIAKNIFELDCDPAVKELLQSLFNHELMANDDRSVTKAFYTAEIERQAPKAMPITEGISE